MPIKNYLCENCIHGHICKVEEKILPFHDDAKKDLGVTVIMHDCENYESVDDDYEEE